MNQNPPLYEFSQEWTRYLEQRDHKIRKSSDSNGPVSSRNCHGEKYRWLMFHSNEPTRRLTAIEHEAIKNQIRQGRNHRETVYVVVKFESPISKVLVLPASNAVRTRLLRSDRAGIPWDE